MPDTVKIGHRTVGEGHPCLIIGEIGMNHDKNLSKAKELISMAAEAGVDAVKFQTFRATDIINPTLPADCDPQEPVPEKYKYFYEYIQDYELVYEWHDELIEYSKKHGLIFISTPCSSEAVQFLKSRLQTYKIASMDLNNKKLLEEVGRQKKSVILSTGIGELWEIERAINSLHSTGAEGIALMHCIANYPARENELNIKAIPMLRQTFDLPVGFSDHSLGINSAIAAVALGACIVEKHITLSRKDPGPDHYFAMEPAALKALVEGIREVESAVGSGKRVLTKDEVPKKVTYRRSLCVTKTLEKGHRLTDDDVVAIRPGSGIDPYDIDKVVGMTLTKNLTAFTPLQWEHFKG